MNFIKTHIYKQEYTDRGVSESIDEARREEEIAEAERLSKLPEFRLNPNRTSLAERLGIQPAFDDEEDDLNPLNIQDAPAVGYEEDEYYEELERQRKEAERERERQDAYILNEFIKAKSALNSSLNDTDTGLYGTIPIVNKNRVKSNISTSTVSAIIKKRQNQSIIEGYDSD